MTSITALHCRLTGITQGALVRSNPPHASTRSRLTALRSNPGLCRPAFAFQVKLKQLLQQGTQAQSWFPGSLAAAGLRATPFPLFCNWEKQNETSKVSHGKVPRSFRVRSPRMQCALWSLYLAPVKRPQITLTFIWMFQWRKSEFPV